MRDVTKTLRKVVLLLVVALAVACGETTEPLDASSRFDGGSTSDGGPVPADTSVFDAPPLSDASTNDAPPIGDAGPRSNPDIVLSREITFEQPNGTNGWADSDSVVFNWQEATTGRNNVPDGTVRMAGGINIPAVDGDVAYRGSHSLRFTMESWGRESFRTDAEIVGDNSTMPPKSRLFDHGATQVVGFAMRIEQPTMPDDGWQLVHQYHNNSPPKTGYGQARNPALAMYRTSDTEMSVVIRSNAPDEERPEQWVHMPNMVHAGTWVRWVFKTRFENFDSDQPGLVEVYAAVGNEPLVLQFRVDDVPLGYAYENPAHHIQVILFGLYGQPLQEDAAMYLDEVRIVNGDVDPSVVDPIEWVSYQHPLNQPYDADLAR